MQWKWTSDPARVYYSSKSGDVYIIETYNSDVAGDQEYTLTVSGSNTVGTVYINQPVTISYAISMGILFLIVYAGIIVMLILRNKLPCVIKQKKRIADFRAQAEAEANAENEEGGLISGEEQHHSGEEETA
eukprot:gnl/Chilomastix_caulleri/859.p1 GENE.gnl/Chilomastix_caulleri/859~~gnl/Chilomastix_caulleri/859.p1  ORF type:complete len:131 (+),score=23.53 gnl/Chilomastix_caulleri/859:143-535(+)